MLLSDINVGYLLARPGGDFPTCEASLDHVLRLEYIMSQTLSLSLLPSPRNRLSQNCPVRSFLLQNCPAPSCHEIVPSGSLLSQNCPAAFGHSACVPAAFCRNSLQPSGLVVAAMLGSTFLEVAPRKRKASGTEAAFGARPLPGTSGAWILPELPATPSKARRSAQNLPGLPGTPAKTSGSVVLLDLPATHSTKGGSAWRVPELPAVGNLVTHRALPSLPVGSGMDEAAFGARSLPELPAMPPQNTSGTWVLPELPTAPSKTRCRVQNLPGLGETPAAAAGGVILPDLPATHTKGGSTGRLPELPAMGDSVIDRPLPSLPCMEELAAVGAKCLPSLQLVVEKTWGSRVGFPVAVRRRLRKKTKFCLRHNARDDLEKLAAVYGSDLASTDTKALPADWLVETYARQLLEEAGLDTKRIDALEVYAGVANWTAECLSLGLQMGPPIDNKMPTPAFGGNAKSQKASSVKWDLLDPKSRRLLWALIVVCKPSWVHSGFPCTFWSWLAHATRKRSDTDDEFTRIREMVHLVLTLQLAHWQCSHKCHISLENPPNCVSWKLDIMKDALAAIGAKKFFFDSCPWGHRDPGNGKPYKKAQCIASTADLSSLVRHCSCGQEKDVHQRVEGLVSILLPGQTRKMRRSTYSGAYPLALCKAWAAVVRANVP